MKTAILTAALALTGITAVAQTAAPTTQQVPRHNPHRAAMRLSRELNLTPDQTARLEPILANRRQQAQAIRANTALSNEARHKQLRTVAASTRLQLADVLTPDQIKQLHALRRQRMQQRAAQPTGA